MFESWLAAKEMMLVPSLMFGGAMTLAVVDATRMLVPQLKGLEWERMRSLQYHKRFL